MTDQDNKLKVDPLNILANVTHELKTPLHSILTVASLLKSESDGSLNEEQKKQVDIILRNGDRLLSLITDLLTFSTIKESLKVDNISIKSIVKDITQRLNPLANKGGIVLNSFFPDSEEEFYSDKKLVTLIVDNLVTNAIKFSKAKSSVEVYYRFLDSENYSNIRKIEQDTTTGIEIVVSDSGIGIDPLIKENIFKEFYQADSGNNRKFGGVGIGLSLVKNAVTKLKGELILQSEIGSGSIFKIILPNLFSSFIKPSILFIGDDPLVVDIIKIILDSNNKNLFKVDFLQTSASLSDLMEKKIDLVILDLSEKILSIDSPFNKIQNSQILKNIPVLGLSSSFDPLERAKYLSECKITDILVKPFQEEEIISKINLLLA